jgi:molybdopterin/thiamine biosynthesis adenylyltransferase
MEEDKIKQNLFYSRQSAAIGKETQSILQNLNVFIVGLNSIGFEILKNLSLFGVRSIGLYDPTPISNDDFYFNFFFEKQHESDPSNDFVKIFYEYKMNFFQNLFFFF